MNICWLAKFKRTDIAKSADYNETTTCEAISPMMATDRPSDADLKEEGGREGREAAPLRARESLLAKDGLSMGNYGRLTPSQP